MRALFLGLLCLTLTAVSSFAQNAQVSFGSLRADPSLPVEVTADTLDVDQSTGQAVFSGNVLIGQGEMRLAAQRVLVIYTEGGRGIERMEATGGVTLVSGPDAAEAERADYTIDSGVIVMTGNVLLTQGPSALAADRMTVNLTSGTAQMVGRVKTILQTGD
ncbi:lipopolysaccharide transport periplasmic protein LptA [Thalassococcus sp. S3]|uniref:lipopolysaccharide transport periplasmic protein LptA n=1 Tax=Thalassococcus sp. S3 TaxID=2017482 RepID=UPI0015828380|nr:lipopolysaccharide transport periplasmic protein LptA [Thalassococcus sp. S3]